MKKDTRNRIGEGVGVGGWQGGLVGAETAQRGGDKQQRLLFQYLFILTVRGTKNIHVVLGIPRVQWLQGKK